MGSYIKLFQFHYLLAAVALFVSSPAWGQTAPNESSSLGQAFNAGVPEVEPVVVGREKWNEKPIKPSTAPSGDEASQTGSNVSESQSGRIGELDPLETQQVKPDPSELKLDPPKIRPATAIVRNFEGKLVFKPRTLGFAHDFPYQLENSKGKRLAYIDVDHLKAIDPQQYVDQQINVMGKLEAVEEGSDDRIIRARIIRLCN